MKPGKESTIELSRLLRLPTGKLQRALDTAHLQSFQAILKALRHNSGSDLHKSKAQQAINELLDGVTGKGDIPRYNDPYVAAAYMLRYHLGHAIMTYHIFQEIFDQIGTPANLYIHDVGAGTGACRVGLALALTERREEINVFFDAEEPSQEMLDTGRQFWRQIKWPYNFDSGYRESRATPKQERKLPPGTLKIVTGFHITLPYDSETQTYSIKGSDFQERGTALQTKERAKSSIREAMKRTQPHLALFTAHEKKRRNLHEAFSGQAIKEQHIAELNQTSELPAIYAYATSEGFETRKGNIGKFIRYRFGPPQGIILLKTGEPLHQVSPKQERKPKEAPTAGKVKATTPWETTKHQLEIGDQQEARITGRSTDKLFLDIGTTTKAFILRPGQAKNDYSNGERVWTEIIGFNDREEQVRLKIIRK